jgi:hypothetical protein
MQIQPGIVTSSSSSSSIINRHHQSSIINRKPSSSSSAGGWDKERWMHHANAHHSKELLLRHVVCIHDVLAVPFTTTVLICINSCEAHDLFVNRVRVQLYPAWNLGLLLYPPRDRVSETGKWNKPNEPPAGLRTVISLLGRGMPFRRHSASSRASISASSYTNHSTNTTYQRNTLVTSTRAQRRSQRRRQPHTFMYSSSSLSSRASISFICSSSTISPSTCAAAAVRIRRGSKSTANDLGCGSLNLRCSEHKKDEWTYRFDVSGEQLVQYRTSVLVRARVLTARRKLPSVNH